jgi:signal transduction histidine kinase
VRLLPPLGIRGRLLAVLVASAAVSAVVLVPVLRDLLVPRLDRDEGERLLAYARVAAARAPSESSRWDAWARDLARAVPGARAILIPSEPGREEFGRACLAAGIPLDLAVGAFLQGEELARRNVPLLEGIDLPDDPWPPVWQALVRIDGTLGERALLAVVELPTNKPPTPVWRLVLLYGAMVSVLAILGGLLAGHFLLVRPVARAVAAARRSAPAELATASGDVTQLPLQVAAIARGAQEDRRRAERLQGELDRIRSDLKGAQSRLIRAEKLASVGQLAAGIAHEIGNPMGIALGMSEILKDGLPSPEEERRFAGEIHGAILRVHGILRDLLNFARPAMEEGAQADVKSAIDATLKLVRPHKMFGSVAVDVQCDEGALVAEIRPSQLQQILLNLLMNAADAMNGTGGIRVRARAADRWILVDVEDEGPGIPEDVLPKIFDPFFSTKPPGEGTGLGLAICAQIVEVYGGDVTVDCGPGRGATFTVRLWRAET